MEGWSNYAFLNKYDLKFKENFVIHFLNQYILVWNLY